MRSRERFPETCESGVPGVFSVSEVLGTPEGQGSRSLSPGAPPGDDLTGGSVGEYRLRSPTRSERMNRALRELETSAFKIHSLLWQWRGSPARGSLPFFTIHSLGKFCFLTRPTVRKALVELEKKGWIIRRNYDKHHKNSLYALVAIRKVPGPGVRRV